MALHPLTQSVLVNVERVLLGKSAVIKLCLAALLADGHILIEDVPGVGKTVLARALAGSIGATFRRIQFTPDLLPGDVTGVQIYNQETRAFEFRPGPIMTQVLLADEINRASPKTQAALLESMDERRVTLDGITHRLPDPFIVLATQNPLDFEGTFPLPESQLDRFLISLRLGYPDRRHELLMLESQEQEHPLDALCPVVGLTELQEQQVLRRSVHVDGLIREYILDIVDMTRRQSGIQLGASPRASLALFQMGQAWALLHGRSYVLPDDVKAVAAAVLRHRVVPEGYVNGFGKVEEIVNPLLERVPVPGNAG